MTQVIIISQVLRWGRDMRGLAEWQVLVKVRLFLKVNIRLCSVRVRADILGQNTQIENVLKEQIQPITIAFLVPSCLIVLFTQGFVCLILNTAVWLSQTTCFGVTTIVPQGQMGTEKPDV